MTRTANERARRREKRIRKRAWTRWIKAGGAASQPRDMAPRLKKSKR